jgi:hypothetical protein
MSRTFCGVLTRFGLTADCQLRDYYLLENSVHSVFFVDVDAGLAALNLATNLVVATSDLTLAAKTFPSRISEIKTIEDSRFKRRKDCDENNF